MTANPVIYTRELSAPLGVSWQKQYVRLWCRDLPLGMPAHLTVDGQPTPFQYTGRQCPKRGVEIVTELEFTAGEKQVLAWRSALRAETDLVPKSLGATGHLSLRNGLGLKLPEPGHQGPLPGPFDFFADFRIPSTIHNTGPLLDLNLSRTIAGPIYTEYRLRYTFTSGTYDLLLRAYREHHWLEVHESFHGLGEAYLELAFDGGFNRLLTHGGFDFEGDAQPTLKDFDAPRPDGALVRLQMPPLGEYVVPGNAGWFAFLNHDAPESPMLGVLGLHGDQWSQSVANTWVVAMRGDTPVARLPLGSGTRRWLLVAAPQEREFSAEHRFLFHRLHAEFNALRLEDHLDLAVPANFDSTPRETPGFFDEHSAENAHRNKVELDQCRRFAGSHLALNFLLEPTAANAENIQADAEGRFVLWIRQFQGWRQGKSDYAKNVIGFSRRLRGLLLGYELLRRDDVLNEDQLAKWHANMVFAARRIADQGRWPHDKTWLHPSHPESVRGTYGYPGERSPDRLIWTNSLPNFQSDPLCALLHLALLLPDHPESPEWQRLGFAELERQLDAYCGADGAWAESLNYALYSLSYFVITFRVVKNRTGIDYFQDERVRRFAEWLVRIFGPLDKRWNRYTHPGLGNVVCPSGGGEYLLAYAAHLEEDDELRRDLLAVYDRLQANSELSEHYPVVLAALAPPLDEAPTLRPLNSEVMTDLGVLLRDRHTAPGESSLFVKAGDFKDHYEADETAFNWYAKDTPFCMEYGTYSPDSNPASAHNVLEVAEADDLGRGFLAKTHFTSVADYIRAEVPVVVRHRAGKPRNFAEIDGGSPNDLAYGYLGEAAPLGPKVWKTRNLLWIKPDYLVLLDEVQGDCQHRFNLHFTGDEIKREDAHFEATGRFDLDLRGYVAHPKEFRHEVGVLAPGNFGPVETNPHRQSYLQIYPGSDQEAHYLTVWFAAERDREIKFESLADHVVQVETPEFTDLIFMSPKSFNVAGPDYHFSGSSGWIRRTRKGAIQAMLIDGERIAAFGHRLEGRGPWFFDGEKIQLLGGPPRPVKISTD